MNNDEFINELKALVNLLGIVLRTSASIVYIYPRITEKKNDYIYVCYGTKSYVLIARYKTEDTHNPVFRVKLSNPNYNRLLLHAKLSMLRYIKESNNV